MTCTPVRSFRSRDWFAAPGRFDMAALYLERFMNYGLTPDELRSGRPIVGIAQIGQRPQSVQPHPSRARASACARASATPAAWRWNSRSTRSSRIAAGRPRRSTATSPISALVEILNGYPIDAVVLTTGCDKTTPSGIMAASHRRHPRDRALGRADARRLARRRTGRLRHGDLAQPAQARRAARSTRRSSSSAPPIPRPSPGHCNTMGTASTMNAVAEALGLSLPGCAAIPAPYRERGQIAYETGRRIVDMAYEDLRPSKILTRASFLNAIAPVTAIGGSTNAQPHLDRDGAPCGHRARPGRLDDGLRSAAARQHAAGRANISGRALSPRRRRAGGDVRSCSRPASIDGDGADRHRQDAGREHRRPRERATAR